MSVPDPGGYYEETVWGAKTWHSTNGQGDLHGDDAVNKADEVFGGPPTDGITGEKGYYGDWKPTRGGGTQGRGGGGGADPNAHEFKPDYNDPSVCQVCGQPRRQHEKVGSRFGPGNDDDPDGEDARGPDGPEMPRGDDLPSYTLFGQILKRFSR